MIGCTWRDGRGHLFSEASAHIMLYILYIDYRHTRSLFLYKWSKKSVSMFVDRDEACVQCVREELFKGCKPGQT